MRVTESSTDLEKIPTLPRYGVYKRVVPICSAITLHIKKLLTLIFNTYILHIYYNLTSTPCSCVLAAHMQYNILYYVYIHCAFVCGITIHFRSPPWNFKTVYYCNMIKLLYSFNTYAYTKMQWRIVQRDFEGSDLSYTICVQDDFHRKHANRPFIL